MSDNNLDTGSFSFTRTGAILALGVALGWLAFLADSLAGASGQFVTSLTSSGCAWGLTALSVGFFASRPRTASRDAATCLTAATILYYSLVLGISRRWELGTTENGGSVEIVGLESLGRATAFWLCAAICGGALLGRLGFIVNHGGGRSAAIAAGTGLGLLAGEGTFNFLNVAWATQQIPDENLLIYSLSGSAVGAAGATVLFFLRKQVRCWGQFLVAAAASLIVSSALWFVLDHFRTSL